MSGNSNWVTRKPSHAIFTMFGLLSVVLLPLGVLTFSSTYSVVSRGLKAKGTVVGIVTRDSTVSGSRGRTESYAPTVSFVTQTGKAVTFESETASNPASHSVGDEVEVIYQPNDPQQAIINSFVHTWLLSTLLLGAGLFCAIITALTLFWIIVSRRSGTHDLEQRAALAKSTGMTSEADRLLAIIDKKANS